MEPQPADQVIKKYEELYNLSKSELDKAHGRFTSIEEKATRHFSILVVLLGFVSIGIPEFIAIARSQTTNWHRLFVSLYSMLATNVLISILFHMRAVSFSRYKNIVINKEMFDFFKENKYIDVIYSLSKRLGDDIKILNDATEKKIRKATLAFKLTHFSILLIILTISVYTIIKLR